MDPIGEIPRLVAELYEIVGHLESYFPGRRFTPDGHLVGSLGEVLAAYHYDLELLPASTETHDAVACDGTMVQIKATQGRSVGIRSEPQHLLVLKILRDGSTEEIFNGPGRVAWKNAGRMQKNGQRQITISKLRQLMTAISNSDRIPGSGTS